MDIDTELLKVDEIFGDVDIDLNDITDTSIPTYPEILLQTSEKGNKYYTAYQSHNRQFINNETDRIVRWKNSSIENINNIIVEKLFLGSTVRSDKSSKEKKNYVRPTSSALFSWSSTDEYIERRKRELRLKGKKINGEEPVKQEEDVESNEDLNHIQKLGINLPNEKIILQLSQKVDNESSQFIHERIQIIKQHHSQKINEMISERKRKDHETHLQRLKQKEEEYERELKMALEEKKDKGLGIFGIFNFNSEKHHSPSNSISGSIDDSSSINGTIDLKKRFSFLPNNLFSSNKNSSKVMPSTPSRSEEPPSRNELSPPNEESPSRIKEPSGTELSPPRDEVVVEFEVPQSPTRSPVNIKGNDLDLMFKMPTEPKEEDDDFDDFEEFTSSPPPQTTEKTIKVHTLMKMNEPTPLINLEDANEVHDTKKEQEEKVNDLLIL